MNDYATADILLAEDSDADAEMILRSLHRANLVNAVTRVHDGVEALDFMFCENSFANRSGGQPCLVLLDLKMPRLGGLDVLRRLKGDERTKRTPIVMLTSSAEERDVIESYDLGVNSYLVKPVDFEGFARVVAQVGLYWAVTNRLPGQRQAPGHE